MQLFEPNFYLHRRENFIRSMRVRYLSVICGRRQGCGMVSRFCRSRDGLVFIRGFEDQYSHVGNHIYPVQRSWYFQCWLQHHAQHHAQQVSLRWLPQLACTPRLLCFRLASFCWPLVHQSPGRLKQKSSVLQMNFINSYLDVPLKEQSLRILHLTGKTRNRSYFPLWWFGRK